MSHLKYFNYPGWGTQWADTYSQAVRVGDRIECAGQGAFASALAPQWLARHFTYMHILCALVGKGLKKY